VLVINSQSWELNALLSVSFAAPTYPNSRWQTASIISINAGNAVLSIPSFRTFHYPRKLHDSDRVLRLHLRRYHPSKILSAQPTRRRLKSNPSRKLHVSSAPMISAVEVQYKSFTTELCAYIAQPETVPFVRSHSAWKLTKSRIRCGIFRTVKTEQQITQAGSNETTSRACI